MQAGASIDWAMYVVAIINNYEGQFNLLLLPSDCLCSSRLISEIQKKICIHDSDGAFKESLNGHSETR